MKVEVNCRSAQQERVVTEHPEAPVAVVAEQTAHMPRVMVMIDIEPAVRLASTYRTAAFVGFLQRSVLLQCHSEVVLELARQVTIGVLQVPSASLRPLLFFNPGSLVVSGRSRLHARLAERSPPAFSVFAVMEVVQRLSGAAVRAVLRLAHVSFYSSFVLVAQGCFDGWTA